MRLADDIALKIGNQTVFLRPSLRAATRLERSHGGFNGLLTAIGDGNLGVIAEAAAVSSDRTDILSAIENIPLFEVMPGLIDGMAKHVLALAGIDPDAPKQPNTGERITFAEYHAKLYRIATGWLGWSPDQAWNATPSEILEAYTGHMEMLRAVHGSAEPERSPGNAPDNAPLDRNGLQSLKDLSGAL